MCSACFCLRLRGGGDDPLWYRYLRVVISLHLTFFPLNLHGKVQGLIGARRSALQIVSVVPSKRKIAPKLRWPEVSPDTGGSVPSLDARRQSGGDNTIGGAVINAPKKSVPEAAPNARKEGPSAPKRRRVTFDLTITLPTAAITTSGGPSSQANLKPALRRKTSPPEETSPERSSFRGRKAARPRSAAITAKAVLTKATFCQHLDPTAKNDLLFRTGTSGDRFTPVASSSAVAAEGSASDASSRCSLPDGLDGSFFTLSQEDQSRILASLDEQVSYNATLVEARKRRRKPPKPSPAVSTSTRSASRKTRTRPTARRKAQRPPSPPPESTVQVTESSEPAAALPSPTLQAHLAEIAEQKAWRSRLDAAGMKWTCIVCKYKVRSFRARSSDAGLFLTLFD